MLRGHTGGVYAVAVADGGAWIASGGEDRTIRIWGTCPPHGCAAVLQGHARFVYGLAPLPGGGFVSSSGEAVLRVWNSKAPHNCEAVLRGHSAYVYAVATHAGRRLMLSGSNDHTLRVWRAGGGDGDQALTVVDAHKDVVSSVALSPDGRQAISGSWDGSLAIWDLEVGDGIGIKNLRHRAVTLSGLRPLLFRGCPASRLTR